MEPLLEKTGERMVENLYRDSPENYLIYLIHIVSYNFVIPDIEGKKVLDYGCGSGYGTHHIAQGCESVSGVDIDLEAISFANSQYSAPNIIYKHIPPCEKAPLPFEDAAFDVVISFQVIEHIKDTSSYLSEIHRVLKPGGLFFCATPNRATRLLPMQKPWNRWHRYEYSDSRLEKVLQSRFRDVEVLHIGGRKDVLDIELNRTRKLMWLAIPFTLPFLPDSVRIYALTKLKHLTTGKHARSTGQEPKLFSFSESDLKIAKDVKPSVDLMAVCKK